MIGFTCFVFFEWDRVNSRTMLGFCSVVAVGLSVVSTFGLMFILGVPFTPMTQALPYILFGIGLDDAFIIMGSYSRTDPRLDPVERIRLAIDDIGISITLTSLTSTLAFALGINSRIPAVYWLFYYAAPSVIFVYGYQLTFFVACIVLDEKRITDRRMDCCSFHKVPQGGGDDTDEDDWDKEEDARGQIVEKKESNAMSTRKVTSKESNNPSTKTRDETIESRVDRIMYTYARMLVHPFGKAVVLLGFAALTVACAISASKIRQEFTFQNVLPGDSYLVEYLNARLNYANLNQMQPGVYFRNEDQSDMLIQQQMKDFINDLRKLDIVSGGPDFCWLYDFETFVSNSSFVQNLDFRYQLGFFLGVPQYSRLYLPDIRRDDDGNILSSRCLINLYNVDLQEVSDEIKALHEVMRVAARQPINQEKDELSFFTSHTNYNTWEFYARSVRELIGTTTLGIFSVAFVALALIPHWSAAPIVLVQMGVLYVDLLGVMQWGGVSINAVSYITLSMSIGLMVDFIIHVLLRYYECKGNRTEKTIEMLRTMGSSILVGGLSTFLSPVPLLLSSSEIFQTIVVTFMGLVTLGVTHGLILLPVLLSMYGTEEQVSTQAHGTSEQQAAVEDDERN
jgi:predicted RND superfamily exporter protein